MMGTARMTTTIMLAMKSKDAAPKKAKAPTTVTATSKKKDKAYDATLKSTLGDWFKEKMG